MAVASSHWGSPVPILGMAHDECFSQLLQAEVWECCNSDGVSVVSIDVGDADRASHRFFLNCFKTANSHLCWCELILLLQ